MRHTFFLAVGVVMLALGLTLTEQHVIAVRAAPILRSQAVQTGRQGQAHKPRAKAAAIPVVREVDLEALKKLLHREPGVDARPLLVNFWATWCEPCRDEFPDLVRINADYAKHNLEVITISLDDPDEIKTTVPKFLREVRAAELPAYLLNVIDPEIVINMIDPQWGGGLPATFLYDASGKMVFNHKGRINAPELRAAIDKVTTVK
jgi:thiol-disulfide isomerase/thioredoxin